MVTSIDQAAFANNRLTSLVIPPSVRAIAKEAFWGNQLEQVILHKRLYDKERGYTAKGEEENTAFGGNPAGLEFYEYDPGKPDNKGKKLN